MFLITQRGRVSPPPPNREEILPKVASTLGLSALPRMHGDLLLHRWSLAVSFTRRDGIQNCGKPVFLSFTLLTINSPFHSTLALCPCPPTFRMNLARHLVSQALGTLGTTCRSHFCSLPLTDWRHAPSSLSLSHTGNAQNTLGTSAPQQGQSSNQVASFFFLARRDAVLLLCHLTQ